MWGDLERKEIANRTKLGHQVLTRSAIKPLG